jgi:transposase
LVDTQGFVLKVQVQPASLSDTQGGKALLTGLPARFPRLQLLWTDQGYMATFANWVQRELGWRVECVRHPAKPSGEYATLLQNFLGETSYSERYPIGFRVLPRRWVVERTFAWLSHQRRLSKDYELLPATGEAWIYLASARLLWKRSVSLTS